MHKLALLIALAAAGLSSAQARAGASLLPDNLAAPAVGRQAGAMAQAAAMTYRMPFAEPSIQMRLVGEADTRRVSFYLTKEQARSEGMLRIAYTNAVSILPDDAALAISLNGQPVSTIAIRSPQGITSSDLKVDPALLVAGWNTVTLTARQHHRVDCSTGAAYELWTQVDPVASGFLSAAAPGEGDPARLLSAGRLASGITELRVIAPSAATEILARQSLTAIQSLALLLGRPDLRVVFRDEAGSDPGIDLYYGDPGSKQQSPETRSVLSAAPNGLSVQDLGNGRVRAVLRGVSEQAIAASLAASLSGPLQQVIAGRQTLDDASRIEAGHPGRVALADLGYRTEPFAGRLFRTGFDLVMPEDFYPGDYAAIKLRLNAATAPKLAPGAQLLVRVNDKAVTSHDLYSSEGVTLKEKPLDLSLRAFHPGLNRIEILAELPREDDLACDPGVRDESRPRFMLLDDTSFEIPALARAGRLPDLASFAGRAYPFTLQDGVHVFVDRASPARIGAAATLLSRLAISAGHPLPTQIQAGLPAPDFAGAALVLTAGEQNQTAGDLRKTDRFSAAALDRLKTASVGLPAVPDASDAQVLLRAFQDRTAADRDAPSVSARFFANMQRASDTVSRWLDYRDIADAAPPMRSSDILARLTQTGNGAQLSSITTLSATSEEDLRRSVETLTQTENWSRLGGGTALVRRGDLAVITQAAQSYSFYPLTDTSIANLRRLAAAWLSDNFLVYVGLIVLLIGGFGLWLGYIVPRKGVRTVP